MSTISTHVLDTSIGRPASGVKVLLSSESETGVQTEISRAMTDQDGRVKGLLPDGRRLAPGIYRLRFEVGAYFANQGVESFYPHAEITFRIHDESHYHVPLLLSPFGFSTYRGS